MRANSGSVEKIVLVSSAVFNKPAFQIVESKGHLEGRSTVPKADSQPFRISLIFNCLCFKQLQRAC
jgi:hypothetical protein